MNTLGSLRYAVMCKKCTCFGLLFLFLILLSLSILFGSSKLSVCLCFSSTSFCHVSSSFYATSFLSCFHHDPSPPFRCLPFSVIFKIFFGVISLFICLFLCLFSHSFIAFVLSVICSFILSFFVCFSLSTCQCDCILLFITLSSKYLFSVLIFSFPIFSFLVFHSILLKNLISLLYT